MEHARDVGLRLAPHGVDRLVHHSEAEFAFHGPPLMVLRFDLERGRFAGLILLAVAGHRHLYLLLHRRDLQIPRPPVKRVVVDEDHLGEHVRRPIRLHRHFNRLRRTPQVNELRPMHALRFDRHPRMRLRHARRDQQPRLVAGLIRALVRNDLHALGHAAPAAAAFHPEPRRAFDLPPALRPGEYPHLIAAAFRRGQRDGRAPVRACGARGAGDHRALLAVVPLIAHQIRAKRHIRHKFALIIARFDVKLRIFSGFHHPSRRLRIYKELAARGHEAARARDFAPAFVRHPSLDAIALVVLAFGNGVGQHELAVGVQPAFALGHLFAAVVFIPIAAVVHFVHVVPGQPVAAAVDRIGELRARHRLAVVVARAHGELVFAAHHQAVLARDHAHFVIGLAVLLDVKAARDRIFARAHVHAVIAERRTRGHFEIHRRCAHLVQRHRAGQHGRALGVLDLHLSRAAPHAVAPQRRVAQNRLQVDGMAGAVHRAVAVDIAAQFALRPAEAPRAFRRHREVALVARHQQQLAHLHLFRDDEREAVRIGLCLARRRVFARSGHRRQQRRAGHRGARVPPHHAHLHLPRLGLRDHRQVRRRDDRVRLFLAVRGFDHVEARAIHFHRHRHALPPVARPHGLLPHAHHLLGIEQGNRGVLAGLAGCGWGQRRGFRGEVFRANRGAAVRGKLPPDDLADPGAQPVLPCREALQRCEFDLRPRAGRGAKLMRVIELQEKLHRIVDPVEPELEPVHALCPHLYSRRLARPHGSVRAEGKVDLGFGPLRRGGQCAHEEHSEGNGKAAGMHHEGSRNRFQRYTPRKLGLPGCGRQRGSGWFISSA